jgi:hypothetical protein
MATRKNINAPQRVHRVLLSISGLRENQRIYEIFGTGLAPLMSDRSSPHICCQAASFFFFSGICGSPKELLNCLILEALENRKPDNFSSNKSKN